MTAPTGAGPATLVQAWWPRSAGSALHVAVLILIGSLLLVASAKLRVPMWPVPATMQTFAVLAIGAAYGWRLGSATVAVYLGYGLVGLPVFAIGAGAGPAYFLGPTGGYLVGFVAAAALVGWLAERGWDRRWLSTAAAMAIGTLVIYVFGVAWLSRVIGGVAPAIAAGVTPFLVGDAVKAALAALLLPLAWRRVR